MTTRPTTRWRFSAPICAVLFVCALFACGGSGGGPRPTPTPPSPTAEPTVAPSPDPTADPTPEPTPPPAPAVDYLAHCGERPPSISARVYLRANGYPVGGRHIDTGVRVQGDKPWCEAGHGVSTDDCNLEFLPQPARAYCGMGLLARAAGKPGALCPVFQYSDASGVHGCSDNQSSSNSTSCDHFGSPLERDDPKTPTGGTTLEALVGFEGWPKECGLQRDVFGPKAGFFTTPHGTPGMPSRVRACIPGTDECSNWYDVQVGE